MYSDPVVDEVRAVREEYARRFNYDIRAIVRDMREEATRQGLKLVTLPPRRLPAAELTSDEATRVDPTQATVKG